MITASKRLVLRYYWPEDIAPIFKSYTGDLGSTKNLARHPHTKIEQTEKMLQNLFVPESMALTGKCIWVVDAIRTGGAIGLVTVVKSKDSMVVHFGIGRPSEFVHHEDFKTRAEAKQVIFEYIEVFYNRVRLHSSNGYMSPADYESALPVAA